MVGARDAAKKAMNELLAWFVAASMSCGLAASVLSYSLSNVVSNGGIAWVLADVLLAAASAALLFLSATMIYYVLRIMRAHGVTPITWGKVRALSEEESAEVIKEAVALYRGYRLFVVAIGVASPPPVSCAMP